jgi:hypothetical protein
MVTDSFQPAPSGDSIEAGSSAATQATLFPPVVYVPCAPLASSDDQLAVDLRRTRDGRLALLVYSALDRLVSCCGDQQAWTVLPSTDLEKVQSETGFELIFLDLEIPEEFRRRSGEN